MSDHSVEVVPIVLEKHPNADSLSIVNIYGFSVVVRTQDWVDKPIGAYIMPDSLVNTTREEFSFLDPKYYSDSTKGGCYARIGVKKLRGIVSMGLLVSAPEGSQLGDNVAEQLDIKHYEPPVQTTDLQGKRPSEPSAPSPPGYFPVFDVENFRKYNHLFEKGEPVFITEKLHGANLRVCYREGKHHVGSRTTWKRYDPNNTWWKAVEQSDSIMQFCRENPNLTLYGEVFGWVQDLRYGAEPGEVRVRIFDVLEGDKWWNAADIIKNKIDYMIPWVPIIAFDYPFDKNDIIEIAEGPSNIFEADHGREGIVIKPMIERTDPEVGRVCLKIISNWYLGR